ncbi:glycosyltransferase family 4 protein [Oceanobacillus alkalisoli]|uniref:glycosyltransferase family 4 protein n=1 Tax=Oceanobacillus alkalisoli TaxID=2925113 RepID=UPI001EF0848F|nr:glycosyltransferase family 4 protein [Oceanobacillus alkalisoli]MCF3942706.1 glycosyltransferase family 4 protein [Oceanobacillus alkalisoli]MCG5102678.1 glycosyltransferase family 4 protein [Oceanobacillus alkalisoli]
MKRFNILIHLAERTYAAHSDAFFSLLNILAADTRIKIDILAETTELLDEIQESIPENARNNNLFSVAKRSEEKSSVINTTEKAITYLKIMEKFDTLIWMGQLEEVNKLTRISAEKVIPFLSAEEESETGKLEVYPFILTDSMERKKILNHSSSLQEKVIYLPTWKVNVPARTPAFVNRRGIAEISAEMETTDSLPEVMEKIKLEAPTFDWRYKGNETDYYSLDTETDIGIVLEEDIHPFLDYAKKGKPVIVPEKELFIALLGEDYPLFIQHPNDLTTILPQLLANEEIYYVATKKCYTLAENFDYERNKQQLLETIHSLNNKQETILFAGHDFKFLYPFIETCARAGKKVLLDNWKGHKRHSRKKSFALLAEADIIFCEWGLGNAVFYQNHVKQGQKLYIRAHRQELQTDYLKKVNYRKVENVITISPQMLEEFHQVHRIPRNKLTLIPNMVDTKKFQLAKKDDARFHLGMIGIIPKLKRIDRAVEIFERLWQEDNRYKLHIKGRLPQDLPWLEERSEEMAYFQKVFEKIDQAPWKENIIFSPFGSDIPEWLTNIGVILSTSDLEAFHLAPMEGMASGATPIVFNWEGADLIYPEECIVTSVDEAVEKIKNLEMNERTKHQHIYERYDLQNITTELMELVFN